MGPIILSILSLVPCLLYYFFLKGQKKDDEQYKKSCRKTLFRGLLTAIPIFLLDLTIMLILSLLGIRQEMTPLVSELVKCFVINAFVEELVKFTVGKKAVKENHDTVSWLDIIAYITISSAGFQITESLVLMLTSSPGQMLVRGLSMMHLAFGMIEGWYYGKYIKTGKKPYQVLSLLLSMIIHGTYNFGLSEEAPDLFGIFSVLAAAASFIYLIYMIFFFRKKKQDPEYTSPIYSELSQEETAAAEE